MKRGEYMLDNNNRFVIKNYGKKQGFASLLPSISGLFGIPIWYFIFKII